MNKSVRWGGHGWYNIHVIQGDDIRHLQLTIRLHTDVPPCEYCIMKWFMAITHCHTVKHKGTRTLNVKFFFQHHSWSKLVKCSYLCLTKLMYMIGRQFGVKSILFHLYERELFCWTFWMYMYMYMGLFVFI